LSIVGAIVGGFLSHLFGTPGARSLDLYSLGVAAVGAVVFLIAVSLKTFSKHEVMDNVINAID
jgi:uncharacterized membrane protein YeaQ/YmgE (transglycosylase-associated protein family)